MAIESLSDRANRAVRTRRRKHPGGNQEALSSASVIEAFRRRKEFSTADVMDRFDAAKDNVTAVMAVLRGRKLVEKTGETEDGASIWGWVK